MAQGPQYQPNPFGPQNVQQQPAKSNTSTIVIIVLAVAFFAMLICGGMLIALLLPAVGAARDAAQRMQRSNNLKMVGIALQNYHSAHKQLPSGYSARADGQVVFNWRVGVAPFAEGQAEFEMFNQEETWDSAANQRVAAMAPGAFQAPGGPPGHTNIFAIVSNNSVFVSQPNTARRYRDILDGLANTIVAIEIPGKSVEWTSTTDVTPDEAWNAIQSLAGNECVHLLMADGTVVAAVKGGLDRETFDAMVTISGKEVLEF